MIDAVIFFGLINVMFEFIVLAMIPPRIRLRILGSKPKQRVMHVMIMILILIIHWGTLLGSMAGFFSFILSMATVCVAKLVFGYIEDDKYHRRIIGYTADELR